MHHRINSSDDSTLANYQLYTLVMSGDSPVTLSVMKSYLGVTTAGQDTFIQSLIDACTTWGQNYTSRDFTDNQYELLIDEFENRISLRRNPIDTIDSVEYTLLSVLTAVNTSVYYLKKGVQLSEILLQPDQEWPTDGDEIEQGIKITFTTEAIGPDKLSLAILAIQRHVAYMFENRGDCGDCGGCADAAGVFPIYNQFRIPRV